MNELSGVGLAFTFGATNGREKAKTKLAHNTGVDATATATFRACGNWKPSPD